MAMAAQNNLDLKIQKENYFEFRNIDPDYYKNYKIPKFLFDALPKDPGAPILDIGCGLGQTLAAIQSRGYGNVRGVDISEEAIRACEKIGVRSEKITDINEFCEQSRVKYDFVMMSHILEHIEKPKIIETLAHIKKFLMNGGASIMIMVPNAQSNTGSYWAYEDFTHTTLFTSGSLYYVLRSSGFNQISFLDVDGLDGAKPLFKPIKSLLLKLYKMKLSFWNRVTGSAFHKPSPEIVTYELKVLAK